jgi:hypothetical protein
MAVPIFDRRHRRRWPGTGAPPTGPSTVGAGLAVAIP